MSNESTTPDLVERTRRFLEATNRRDLDAMMAFYAPDAVMDGGLGIYEGASGIRGFFEDWLGNYDESRIEAEEILDLGNGVVFAVISQNARPVGSSGYVHARFGAVNVWDAGLVVRTTNYFVDEARSAAGRLAEERGPDGW
jgi:ketosteroid isomerase-like protein